MLCPYIEDFLVLLKKMSTRLPRLHDLSLCTLFGSSKYLPWITGTTNIRQPPRTPLMMMMNENEGEISEQKEIQLTKRKLNKLITKIDPDFIRQTLKKDLLDNFLLLQQHQQQDEDSGVSSWNPNSCIHLPGSLYLSLRDIHNQNEESSKANLPFFITNASNNNEKFSSSSSNFVNFWIHCSSFSQIHQVSSSLIHFREKNKHHINNIGICLPFPSNTMCGNVLFGMGKKIVEVATTANGDVADRNKSNNSSLSGNDEGKSDDGDDDESLSQYEEKIAETLQMLREENIPSSIWLLSGMSCPFGGPVSVDPVETSDHIVTFVEEFGCNEIFVDDTAGTIHPRLFSDHLKTLIAVSASSPSSSLSELSSEDTTRTLFDKISFCFRTSQDNSKLRKLIANSPSSTSSSQRSNTSKNPSNKIFAHRCVETILHQELNERIYRNFVKGYSFSQSAPTAGSGLMNFCGSVNTENFRSIVHFDVDEESEKENEKSHHYDKSNTFVPLPLFADWNAELIGSTFEVDPMKNSSETTMEAQKRFELMEKKLSKNVGMLHKLNDVL